MPVCRYRSGSSLVEIVPAGCAVALINRFPGTPNTGRASEGADGATMVQSTSASGTLRFQRLLEGGLILSCNDLPVELPDPFQGKSTVARDFVLVVNQA